ncbi:hypothetical protein [Edaphobacter aggregans]|uniref:hypothetical protein n=1 Tax=Edaphobacter aggregans TaxID=570835 RepID=UPI00068D3D90|nr:hypothetical protein [Edaphobacter aggregans]
MIKSRILLAVALFASPVLAQQEGPVATQTIVTADSKTPQKLSAQTLKIKVNGHETPLASVVQVPSNGAQVALLIDDGLRSSVARQLNDLKNFITSLPAGTEILVGYMQNGRVDSGQDFTTDHAAAAQNLRIPLGTPGASASPYFCLSDFIQKWPEEATGGGTQKARFVMMLTNGVDPYNGSVSPMNQNSVYVDNAIRDAQRAGVPVYSIYYGDAGFHGGAASFSGQNYLSQVAEATGGRAYFQGTGSPVSLTPFLTEFRNSIAESYVATFNASSRSNLVDIRFSTSLPGTKVRAPQNVRPGTRILASGQLAVTP